MTICSSKKLDLKAQKGRKVEISFDGGDITSDGGVLLLQKADERIGLLKQIAARIRDPRRQASCEHSVLHLLRQRVYGIALGYEDLNDHDTLRNDLAIQTAVGAEKTLGSHSTLSRLEHWADRDMTLQIHEIMFNQFVSSFKEAPSELILDFDATDDVIHGNQEGAYYHGYYGNYCFLPLYVTCGDKMLVSYLRRSTQDQAKHAWAIFSILVKKLKKVWPQVRIIFRGDGGFCRHKMLAWCERQENVFYVVGIAKNKRILDQAEPWISQAAMRFDHTQEKQRVFGEITYQAGSWDRPRFVIIKAEHLEKGANPRFIITNMRGQPSWLYEDIYCARGEMENRIKEQQLDLYADRTSCHDWWPNQLRLLLSSLAYILVESIRSVALTGSILAQATAGTIRLKLFKIGAVILRNTRRIRFLFSSSYPNQDLFLLALQRLVPQ
jgi:hypothetical protein